MNYRPDIDGLRAIAVLSVLVFHLDPSLLSGGFIGVDVFFVISGYLITQIIRNEIVSTEQFRFGRFYLRRARRLLPAMLVTFLFTLLAGAILFPPPLLTELGKSLIYAIFSLSNFFFWSISSYFDSSSDVKPLLHTWSLSIEEQFYLIWPAALLLLCRRNTKWLAPVTISLLLILSLVLNLWFFSEQEYIRNLLPSPNNDDYLDIPTTVFYLLPFRVFEFAIGALLVWSEPFTNQRKNTYFRKEILFSTGLLMVLYSAVQFTQAIEFPSYNALLPCLGTALMISNYGHRLSFITENRLMVNIGLVSYSLYLVHWPIIVFYKYHTVSELTFGAILLLFIMSFVAAYLLYKFVEQPFRLKKNKSTTNNKPFLSVLAASIAGLLIVSLNISMSQGWLWRYPPEVLAQLNIKKGDYEYLIKKYLVDYQTGFSDNNKPKILVIGDSMAADTIQIIEAADQKNELEIASIRIESNCKGITPLEEAQYKIVYKGKAETCRIQHQKLLNSPEIKQADTIILASFWFEKSWLEHLQRTILHFNKIGTQQLMVVAIKSQTPDGTHFINKHVFTPNNHLLRTPPHPLGPYINRRIHKLDGDFQVINFLENFCNKSGCQRITEDGYLIIFDGSHVTSQGASFIAQKITSDTHWFAQLFKKSTIK